MSVRGDVVDPDAEGQVQEEEQPIELPPAESEVTEE